MARRRSALSELRWYHPSRLFEYPSSASRHCPGPDTLANMELGNGSLRAVRRGAWNRLVCRSGRNYRSCWLGWKIKVRSGESVETTIQCLSTRSTRSSFLSLHWISDLELNIICGIRDGLGLDAQKALRLEHTPPRNALWKQRDEMLESFEKVLRILWRTESVIDCFKTCRSPLLALAGILKQNTSLQVARWCKA